MNVLRFRRDRRQRDPFTAAPVTRARFEDPHGIATDATLEALTAQAAAETAEAWYGLTELDVPPAHDRPYVGQAAEQLGELHAALILPPVVPVTAEESASRMARLTYPAPDATREQYAACMRQVSAWTGTRSGFDWPAAWTSARPGPAEPTVTCWTPQHAPLLAIEAPKGMAA